MQRDWYSSYEKNNYGDFFYSLIRLFKPETVVELGTKAGYSAFHIAKGLKDNSQGKLICYDLWEDYQFNHVPKVTAEENLKEFRDIVNLNHQNAIGAEKNYQEVDILHIDLSHDGKDLEKIVPYWIDKVRKLIIIEGGSAERDHVEWMVKYKKKPIKQWLKEFTSKRPDIEFITIEPFPSITIIRKK